MDFIAGTMAFVLLYEACYRVFAVPPRYALNKDQGIHPEVSNRAECSADSDTMRETIRTAYSESLSEASKDQLGPSGADPHHTALAAALAYHADNAGDEITFGTMLWPHVAPFLHLDRETACGALAEYVVYRQDPDDAEVDWLACRLQEGYERGRCHEGFQALTHIAGANTLEWFCLITIPDNDKHAACDRYGVLMSGCRSAERFMASDSFLEAMKSYHSEERALLADCTACGQRVSRTASACPSCGESAPGMRCPACGSTHVTMNQKGFGLGNAATGMLLLGLPGLLGGMIGRKKTQLQCQACPHKWDLK